MEKSRWLGGFLALALSVVAGVGTAVAADPEPVSVTIQGEAVVGGTLDAVVVTDVLDPTIAYQWKRCDVVATNRCQNIPGATALSYVIADADLGYPLRVGVTVTTPSAAYDVRSEATAVVVAAPTPPPDPTPVPDPTPPPDPTPVPAPTPTPTSDPTPTTDPVPFVSITAQDAPATGIVTPPASFTAPALAPTLPAAPTRIVRLLRPFPVVRIAGLSVAGGAYINLLRVSASRGTSVSVDCRGLGCPVRRLVLQPGRVRQLERFLPAGVVITIRVTRAGYVGKYVRLVIGRRAAPQRRDACLLPGRTRPTPCTG